MTTKPTQGASRSLTGTIESACSWNETNLMPEIRIKQYSRDVSNRLIEIANDLKVVGQSALYILIWTYVSVTGSFCSIQTLRKSTNNGVYKQR